MRTKQNNETVNRKIELNSRMKLLIEISVNPTRSDIEEEVGLINRYLAVEKNREYKDANKYISEYDDKEDNISTEGDIATKGKNSVRLKSIRKNLRRNEKIRKNIRGMIEKGISETKAFDVIAKEYNLSSETVDDIYHMRSSYKVQYEKYGHLIKANNFSLLPFPVGSGENRNRHIRKEVKKLLKKEIKPSIVYRKVGDKYGIKSGTVYQIYKYDIIGRRR